MSDIQERMKKDWNRRAKSNPRKYVASASWKTTEEFEKSGWVDASKVLQGIDVGQHWIALEVGVGVGRIARHLANRFGEIYGVDVSDEMVRIANAELGELENVRFIQNNGADLPMFPDNTFDFVYSVKVFQHLPRRIFGKYLHEIQRVLKPGALWKFQVFENRKILNLVPWCWLRNLRHCHLKFWQDPPDDDTWIARSYSMNELSLMLGDSFDVIDVENPTRTEGDFWVTARVRK
jgi:ubiquinone/menaquinone biosynthesis C-methylase UbiE